MTSIMEKKIKTKLVAQGFEVPALKKALDMFLRLWH